MNIVPFPTRTTALEHRAARQRNDERARPLRRLNKNAALSGDILSLLTDFERMQAPHPALAATTVKFCLLVSGSALKHYQRKGGA